MMQGRLIGLVTMIPRCSGQMSSLFRRQLVVTGTNHIRLGAPTMMMTLRSFSTTNNNKKKKKQQPARKLSSKQRRKRESEKAKRRNEWLAREKKLKRQKNLHPAAKMKRILSATDYWFSHVNLMTDHYVKEQLYWHKGYIPLVQLLTFPKFKHWVDLPLLYQAYTNPAAKKRYKVIISQELIQHGKAEAKRQEQLQRNFEKNRAKREKERKRRQRLEARRRKRLRTKRYDEVFEIVRQRLFENLQKQVQEEAEIKQANAKQALREEASVRGFLERNLTYTKPIVKMLEAVDSLMKSTLNAREELTLDDIDDEDVHYAISDEYAEEFCDYLELQDLNDDDDDLDVEYPDYYQPNRQNDWNVSKKANIEIPDSSEKQPGSDSAQDLSSSSNVFVFDPLMQEQDANPTEETGIENENLISNSATDDAEDVEQEKQGNEDVNLEHALVRHKRVTFEYLQELSRPIVDVSDEMKESIYDGYSDTFVDQWSNEWDGLEEGDDKPKKPKKSANMKQYSIVKSRQVMLINTPGKLKNFCDLLMESVRTNVAAHGDDPNFSAIGFDVEYCSLELDIRNTLPAMIQLAGPGNTAPVGLIWLDKFPNHGQNVIGMDNCQPLLDILADHKILKIGVGASKDVNHLAKWWGINDRKFIDYYFAGIIDLEYEGNTKDTSLAEMCKSILNKRLPKSKEKLSKNQKKRKKAGRRTPTAHWRRKDITKEMKEYAANDAACGIDVWMKLKTDTVDDNDDDDETLSEASS